MYSEKDILAALRKPLTLYEVKARVAPDSKGDVSLQDTLMRMRAEGKLRFDIYAGKWAKAA
jgi:hypothetical protein